MVLKETNQLHAENQEKNTSNVAPIGVCVCVCVVCVWEGVGASVRSLPHARSIAHTHTHTTHTNPINHFHQRMHTQPRPNTKLDLYVHGTAR